MKTFENQSLTDMIMDDGKLLKQIFTKLAYRVAGVIVIMLELGVQLGIQLSLYVNNY